MRELVDISSKLAQKFSQPGPLSSLTIHFIIISYLTLYLYMHKIFSIYIYFIETFKPELRRLLESIQERFVTKGIAYLPNSMEARHRILSINIDECFPIPTYGRVRSTYLFRRYITMHIDIDIFVTCHFCGGHFPLPSRLLRFTPPPVSFSLSLSTSFSDFPYLDPSPMIHLILISILLLGVVLSDGGGDADSDQHNRRDGRGAHHQRPRHPNHSYDIPNENIHVDRFLIIYLSISYYINLDIT